jgi:hypothetical protein
MPGAGTRLGAAAGQHPRAPASRSHAVAHSDKILHGPAAVRLPTLHPRAPSLLNSTHVRTQDLAPRWRGRRLPRAAASPSRSDRCHHRPIPPRACVSWVDAAMRINPPFACPTHSPLTPTPCRPPASRRLRSSFSRCWNPATLALPSCWTLLKAPHSSRPATEGREEQGSPWRAPDAR